MKNRTIHILLVEDEEADAELIQRAFAARSELRASGAGSVRQATTLRRRPTPDLPLLATPTADGEGPDPVKILGRDDRSATVLLTGRDEARQTQPPAAGARRDVARRGVARRNVARRNVARRDVVKSASWRLGLPRLGAGARCAAAARERAGARSV